MRFESSAIAGMPLGLVEAALRGLPGPVGTYLPCGEADLRPALYAPASDFADFAAAAVLALFPGELDPFLAQRLAAPAFADAPASFAYGEDILVLDLARGSSGSSADYGAAFLASVLAAVHAATPRLILAAGDGPEGAALAEAFADDDILVLLRPEGAELRGVGSARLARSGGRVLVLDIEGGGDGLSALLGAASGRTLAGFPATIACPANPARFAARVILHAAAFSLASRGSSGDVLGALGPGDDLALAAGLWCWRLGLPQGGLVVPRIEFGAARPGTGRELVERFGADNPGVVHSLVRCSEPSERQAKDARQALAAAGGPELDLASAYSLAAAELALDTGLRGHARIVVYREALPVWDAGGPVADGIPRAAARPIPSADASVPPNLDALDAALVRLRGELELDSRIG
jgi:threonine synthase